uniref:Photosynthetic NDH subcomplex B 4 n=1 Tax=Geranium incanum TaxID=1158081 RepID=A0A0F7GXW1_9ROSI
MAEAMTCFKPQPACFSSPATSIFGPIPPSPSLNLQRSGKSRRGGRCVRANALPDWPLMAVLVEHMEGQRDLITTKSIVHLSDQAIKNVYVFYIMFTVWGCMFFGSTKDPYYDSEMYRGDGGDGTGHCFYEKQDEIEEAARAALWREELIEEIEQKVGEVRDLEEVRRS